MQMHVRPEGAAPAVLRCCACGACRVCGECREERGGVSHLLYQSWYMEWPVSTRAVRMPASSRRIALLPMTLPNTFDLLEAACR